MNNLQVPSSTSLPSWWLHIRLPLLSFRNFGSPASALQSLPRNAHKFIHIWAWLPRERGSSAAGVLFVRTTQFPLCRYRWRACNSWDRGPLTLPWPFLHPLLIEPPQISKKIAILLSFSLPTGFIPIFGWLLPMKIAIAGQTLLPFLAASPRNRTFEEESRFWR